MTNLLGSAEQVKYAGSLFAPAGGARVAMIDPRDIAAVAAVALTDDGHDGDTYVLTGPETIIFEHITEELSIVGGRPVQFVAIPDDAVQHAMVENGMPEFVVGQIVSVLGFLRRGDQNRITDAVRAMTGRDPLPFARFAHDYAEMFRACRRRKTE